MFESFFSVFGRNWTAIGLLVALAALVVALSIGPPSSRGPLGARGLFGR